MQMDPVEREINKQRKLDQYNIGRNKRGKGVKKINLKSIREIMLEVSTNITQDETFQLKVRDSD